MAGRRGFRRWSGSAAGRSAPARHTPPVHFAPSALGATAARRLPPAACRRPPAAGRLPLPPRHVTLPLSRSCDGWEPFLGNPPREPPLPEGPPSQARRHAVPLCATLCPPLPWLAFSTTHTSAHPSIFSLPFPPDIYLCPPSPPAWLPGCLSACLSVSLRLPANPPARVRSARLACPRAARRAHVARRLRSVSLRAPARLACIAHCTHPIYSMLLYLNCTVIIHRTILYYSTPYNSRRYSPHVLLRYDVPSPGESYSRRKRHKTKLLCVRIQKHTDTTDTSCGSKGARGGWKKV